LERKSVGQFLVAHSRKLGLSHHHPFTRDTDNDVALVEPGRAPKATNSVGYSVGVDDFAVGHCTRRQRNLGEARQSGAPRALPGRKRQLGSPNGIRADVESDDRPAHMSGDPLFVLGPRCADTSQHFLLLIGAFWAGLDQLPPGKTAQSPLEAPLGANRRQRVATAR
jgi:hypothetical protein